MALSVWAAAVVLPNVADAIRSTTIKTTIESGLKYGMPESLHEALKTRDDILELDVRMAWSGCVGWEGEWQTWNLPLAVNGSDHYAAAPQILRLEEYDFGHNKFDELKPSEGSWLSRFSGVWPSDWPSRALGLFYWAADFVRDPDYTYYRRGAVRQWMKLSDLPAEQLQKSNLDLWLDAMDFSGIHTLAIKSPRQVKGVRPVALYERLPSSLPKLRSLLVEGIWAQWDEEPPLPLPPALEFVLAFPPSSLDSLAWVNSNTSAPEVFDATLQHHGSSLTSLEWREEGMSSRARPTLSVDQITRLADWAPNLQSLTLELNHEGDAWPVAHLEALARGLPNLTDLTIYFDMESECGRESLCDIYPPRMQSNCSFLAEPRLTRGTGLELFRMLREIKAGAELTNVTFRAGNWGRPWDGPLTIGECWMEYVKVWIDCSVFRSDGQRKAEGEAWCDGKDSLNELPDWIRYGPKHYESTGWYDEERGMLEELDEEEELGELQQPLVM